MKFKIIFTLIILPNILLGQTKNETENWLSEKLTFYSFDYKGQWTEKLYFDDGNLYHFNKSFLLDYTSENYAYVGLKDIIEIDFYSQKSLDNSSDWIELRLKFEKGKMRKMETLIMNKEQTDPKFVLAPERTAIIYRLNTEFMKGDMKTRLEKALQHLITLYGGNVKLKKEPF